MRAGAFVAVVVTISLVTPAVSFPNMTFTGVSHEEFGYAMGERMARLIAYRYDADETLRELEEWAGTESGQFTVAEYFNTHLELYPEFISELKGLADGSNQPFSRVLLMNLKEELSYYLPSLRAGNRSSPDHCSDYIVQGNGVNIGGHNEDSSLSTVNRTFLLEAQVGDEPSFRAYCYAGELPTVAFGLNEHGIGFTLNFVQPSKAWTQYGVARNFISRSLLTATSWEHAVSIIKTPDQGSGHSVNLFDFRNKKMANFETASSLSATTYPNATTPLFHANVYMHLNVSYPPDPSSAHRMARAKVLPRPTDVQSVLTVLGDTGDPVYPIYQMGGPSGLYTMATAVYDLDGSTVKVVTGNPLTNPTPLCVWTVSTSAT